MILHYLKYSTTSDTCGRINPLKNITRKRNIEAFLLLSNFILVLGTVIILGTAFYLYQRKIQTVTLTDNRFLTTEWHLLQELKANTDRQLQEKDQEIARLHEEYDRLKKMEQSPARLLELETELHKAETERAAILTSRITATPQPEPTASKSNSTARTATAVGPTVVGPTVVGQTSAAASAAVPPGQAITPPDSALAGLGQSAKPLAELLGERIAALESQSANYRMRAEIAEKNLEAYIKNNSRAKSDTPAVSPAAATLLAVLEQKKNDLADEPALKIEHIKTRALLRAIVSSPAIRKEYPELLNGLDSLFLDYARQEWLRGQKDAVAYTIESLKTLMTTESAPQSP